MNPGAAAAPSNTLMLTSSGRDSGICSSLALFVCGSVHPNAVDSQGLLVRAPSPSMESLLICLGSRFSLEIRSISLRLATTL
jgi:hypothetical protein